MAKLNLNDLANLQNETTVVSTINNNNQLIEQAIELTLTRTGTSPNAMETSLDMNSNRILNLPLPVSDVEPVRKGEFDELVEDTVGVVEEAQQARDEAIAAKEAAEAAQTGAELAETNAEAAQLAAENAKAAAELAQTNAETAETNAEAAQLAAENAQAAAELAQTNAETAETNAETAETNAEAAQLAAENAKAAAELAQLAAENARDDAIQAAAEAENAADSFDDVYLGSKPSDPTVDNDGDPLVEGQLYWNNVGNNLRIYDGASWQAYSAASGMTALVDDTNPSLGGNLDLNSNDITGTGDINITGSVTATTINQGANNVLDDGDIGVTVQAYDADLTSWAGVTRASGFDTFAATPSSANLAALVTDGTGSGALVFGTSPTLTTPNLGTPSAVNLTNGTNLPISGITPSTSAALGVGSIELGHASDTTLSRSAAGKLDVEGHTVLTDDEENQGPILGGATVTPKALGTISSGTVTVDVGDRPMQSYTNNGAHTLASSGTGSTVLRITNGSSAGAITLTAFSTRVYGDPFDTTNGSVFRCVIEDWTGSAPELFVQKLV